MHRLWYIKEILRIRSIMCLPTSEYDGYRDAHPEDMEFDAQTGAEAIRHVLSTIDLHAEVYKLEADYGKDDFGCFTS